MRMRNLLLMMNKTKFVCFSVACGFTLLLIVLWLQLDITKAPLLSHSNVGRRWTVPLKKTTVPGMINNNYV